MHVLNIRQQQKHTKTCAQLALMIWREQIYL